MDHGGQGEGHRDVVHMEHGGLQEGELVGGGPQGSLPGRISPSTLSIGVHI